jgi:hypothetical protein
MNYEAVTLLFGFTSCAGADAWKLLIGRTPAKAGRVCGRALYTDARERYGLGNLLLGTIGWIVISGFKLI